MSEFSWINNGLILDLPDFRDWPYEHVITPNYQEVDLRNFCSSVENQGVLGSCVACATVGALEVLENITNQTYVELSKLFVYYNTRAIDGSIGNNDYTTGSSIRNAIKTIVDIGVCQESLWPYDTGSWNIVPTDACFSDAINHRVVSYYRLSTIGDMINCLRSGHPFICGIPLYQSLFDSTFVPLYGNIPMPIDNDTLVSGHAVLIVGFNLAFNMFIFKNSWGTDWANSGVVANNLASQPGYGTLPFAYLTDLPQYDKWTIRQYYTPADTFIPPTSQDTLNITVMPLSGSYRSTQQVSIIANLPGKIYYSINNYAYQVYTQPITVSSSMFIKYYFRDVFNKNSDTYILEYTIDTNPLVLTINPPAGMYKDITVSITSNKACEIFYMLPNGTIEKYINPFNVSTSTSIIYHGVANNIVYETYTTNYTIEPSLQTQSYIMPTPGIYYCTQVIELHTYENDTITYKINGGIAQIYNGPFILTETASIEYYCTNGGIVNTAIYTITDSNIEYRIDGGPWIAYTKPIDMCILQTIEAREKYPDGTYSSIDFSGYKITDTQNRWRLVG